MMDMQRELQTLWRTGVSLALAGLIAGCNASGAPEGAKITTSGGAPVASTQPTMLGSTANAGAPYKVVPGDTVYSVAQRMNVPVNSLIQANGLQPPYRLQPGQQLVTPGGGTYYDPDLAVANTAPTAYGTTGANGGASGGDTDGTYAGSPPRVTTSTGGSIAMEELSPAAGGGAPAATTTPSPTASTTPPASSDGTNDVALIPSVKPTAPSSTTANSAPASSGAAADTEVAAIPNASKSGGRFQWPLQGEVVSRFGAKIGGQQNDGINIAGEPGAKVVAADGGVVAYSGNELRGFGNLLLIRHADGWITAYAHNQKLLVKKGDKVQRGQPIATVGATGNVESPQLHFEIRRGSDPVDPMTYLGGRG